MHRRSLLTLLAATALPVPAALAATPRNITWDDLIPPGVPYSEIIGQGEIDEVNDTWNPIFDENGIKLNEELNGAYIRMPGYVIPLDYNSTGINDFILVPYAGACIHVPPPPPNQLVVARTDTPWPTTSLWDAVWVTGTLRTALQTTALADTGYAMEVERMEAYRW